jgi:L-ascorbate metabolism protein UlaG (beta-lactamase superfamily)
LQLAARQRFDRLDRKGLKVALLLFLGFSTHAFGAGLSSYSQLVVNDSVTTPRNAVRVTYLGTNGFELRSGNHVLLVDPYFSRINLSRIALGATIEPDLQRIDDAMKHLGSGVDAIVVTHGHFDHLLDVPVIMQKIGARLIASRAAVSLAERAGASASRCEIVMAGNIRRIGPWKISAFAATHDRLFCCVPFAGEPHGDGPPRRAADWVCGEPLAYLIEINGAHVYVDSGGTTAVLPPANIMSVDLAILGVALPDSRARFSATVQRLRPSYVFPSHQDNFFRPLSAGFAFGPLTDFPRLLRDCKKAQLPGRLILLDYFRPWTLRRN